MLITLKKILLNLFSIFIAFFIFFILAEVVLRILPTSDAIHSLTVNADNPVLRHKENRDFTWSNGWNFSKVVHKHTNNYGFMSDYDYDPKLHTPLMSVIGDSFVAALQVENKDSFHGILANDVGDKGRVYELGSIGAPLSTYLAYANYARKEFKPNSMVFTIIANDFDESFWDYKKEPGFHYFELDNNGNYAGLKRIDSNLTTLTKIARHSAVLRYLFINMDIEFAIQNLLKTIQLSKEEKQNYVGNVDSTVTTKRMDYSLQSINIFLKELPSVSGLDPKEILFVVDALRPSIYSSETLARDSDSYFAQMRNAFMKQAEAKGYKVVDMQPIFLDHYSKHHQRFESPDDGHWNELGHRLVAEAVETTSVYQDTFKN